MIRLGAWTLTVEARDIYGNAGSASLAVVVELYVAERCARVLGMV